MSDQVRIVEVGPRDGLQNEKTPVSVEGRWLIDGSLSSNQPVLEAQDLGADEIYLITTATAARSAPPRGALAIAMNSVSLLSMHVARLQLEEARRRAEQTGGHVHIVPSAEPSAPGRFDYRRSAALCEQAYRRTQCWLSDLARQTATPPLDARGPGPAAAASREPASAQRPPNSWIPVRPRNPTLRSP